MDALFTNVAKALVEAGFFDTHHQREHARAACASAGILFSEETFVLLILYARLIVLRREYDAGERIHTSEKIEYVYALLNDAHAYMLKASPSIRSLMEAKLIEYEDLIAAAYVP